MKEQIISRWQTVEQYISNQQLPLAGWRNLFSWDFWTESYLNSQSPYYLTSFLLALIVAILLLAWRFYLARQNKKIPVYETLLGHLGNLVFFLLLGSLFYWFCRTQEIVYLSSRLVILALIVVSLVWLIYIGFWAIRLLPAKKLRYLEKDRYLRYLPKSKKNKND